MKGTFRSLHNYNYRVWAGGALISNIGTWMQRTAQDWLVLVQLTHESATAVGIVMALQFGPYLLLMPFTGLAADRFDRRRLVMVTQALSGLLALVLGALTLTGVVQLWHVYVFAFLFGCVSAFDSTARQTFVAELVGDKDLSNAVGLNSTSFNAARMIGPAVAGVLIAAIGSGWVFLLNAASFGAVLLSLRWLRLDQLRTVQRSVGKRGKLREGFTYVRGRPDLLAILWMYFLIGTFGLNFPIFISTMSVTVFHQGPSEYGVLTSCMAVGSVLGALLSASRATPRIGMLLVGALLFGFGTGLAALMPGYWLVRPDADGGGYIRADLHHHRQQHGSAVHRPGHARPGHGHSAGHRRGWHAVWCTHRRLGRRCVRAALGAGHWCGIGLAGGRRGGALHGPLPRVARVDRRAAVAP